MPDISVEMVVRVKEISDHNLEALIEVMEAALETEQVKLVVEGDPAEWPEWFSEEYDESE